MGLFSKRDPEDLLHHAAVFMQKGQPKGAVGLYNQVLKQDPGNLEALHQKGIALNQMKKYTDTVTCADHTLSMYPDDAIAHNCKGVALAEMGDTQTAAECYDMAMASDPRYYESYFNKGVLLARLKDLSEALDHMEKAVQLNRTNPVPLLHKAIILGKMHRNKDALKILERLERRFGAHSDITFQRGVQMAELGQHRRAIDVFEGISDKRDNAVIQYSLARSWAALGDGETAMNLLKSAISGNKSIRSWAKKESVFLPLREDPRFRKMVKF